MLYLRKLKWYHFTRGVGAFIALYELVFDKGGSERGTIILAGLGVAGYDLVARKPGLKDGS